MAKEPTPQKNLDIAAPAWASEFLKVREWADIVHENPSTIYRKINGGIYPAIIHIGGSARLAGWECWACVKERMANRNQAA